MSLSSTCLVTRRALPRAAGFERRRHASRLVRGHVDGRRPRPVPRKFETKPRARRHVRNRHGRGSRRPAIEEHAGAGRTRRHYHRARRGARGGRRRRTAAAARRQRHCDRRVACHGRRSARRASTVPGTPRAPPSPGTCPGAGRAPRAASCRATALFIVTRAPPGDEVTRRTPGVGSAGTDDVATGAGATAGTAGEGVAGGAVEAGGGSAAPGLTSLTITGSSVTAARATGASATGAGDDDAPKALPRIIHAPPRKPMKIPSSRVAASRPVRTASHGLPGGRRNALGVAFGHGPLGRAPRGRFLSVVELHAPRGARHLEAIVLTQRIVEQRRRRPLHAGMDVDVVAIEQRGGLGGVIGMHGRRRRWWCGVVASGHVVERERRFLCILERQGRGARPSDEHAASSASANSRAVWEPLRRHPRPSARVSARDQRSMSQARFVEHGRDRQVPARRGAPCADQFERDDGQGVQVGARVPAVAAMCSGAMYGRRRGARNRCEPEPRGRCQRP